MGALLDVVCLIILLCHKVFHPQIVFLINIRHSEKLAFTAEFCERRTLLGLIIQSELAQFPFFSCLSLLEFGIRGRNVGLKMGQQKPDIKFDFC